MSNTDQWESGELGRDEQYVQVAHGMKEIVDAALGVVSNKSSNTQQEPDYE